MKRSLSRPQPATLISLLALFVALGGSSYAAITVSGKNIKNSSVTGKDIKNKSLGAGELSSKARRTLKGAKGATGATGATGAKGANGGTSVVIRTGTQESVPAGPNGVQVLSVGCDPGERAVGGGGNQIAGTDIAISRSVPTEGDDGIASEGDIPTGWRVDFVNDGVAVNATPYVVCAKP